MNNNRENSKEEEQGGYGKCSGHDTGIADCCNQRLEEGKETRISSMANQAGIGGCQARSRFTTPSCPPADACQSGM